MKFSATTFFLGCAVGGMGATALPLVINITKGEAKLLPFQGRLTDSNGAAITDGAKVVEFKIYDAPTGGTVKWAGEVHKLSVNGGLVNTLLGSKANLGNVDFSTPTYLQITIDANNDSQITAADPPLLPRQSVVPSVFAMEAQQARGMQWVNAQGIPQGSANWSALFGNGQDPSTAALGGDRIADGSISANKLTPNGGFTDAYLAADSVKAKQLADNSVDSNAIVDGGIKTSDIADASVTGAKIAPTSIPPNRLAIDMAIVVDEKPTGTPGGAATSNSWVKRTLNKTAFNQGTSISLSNNAVALVTGTYYIEGRVPGYNTQRHCSAIRESGTMTEVLRGSSAHGFSGSYSDSILSGVIEVTSPSKTFEVWQFIQRGVEIDGLGVETNAAGSAEVYTSLKITRIK